MNNHRQIKLVLVAFAAALIIAGITLITAPAKASSNSCIASHQAPHSAKAEECKAKGWTIRKRIVVNPRGVVRYSSLPHCSGPVSRSCTWNVIFSRDRSVCDGDCYRAPYWADPQGRIHYVLGTRQRKELLDPLYVDCEYVYCGIVGPDQEDRAPASYPISYPQVEVS